jgi:hypothetical protein
VLASASGFLCGVCYPTWKASVEPAQVIAGVVSYPAQNPNFMQQVKMFTIVHEMSSLLLRLGVSEWTLSWLLSGIEATFLFLAVGLPIFAFSGRSLLAAWFPFLLVRALDAGIPGVSYPLSYLGNEQNWGPLGLAAALVALGLFIVERPGVASFAAGLAPAVHPALGCWLLLALFGVVAYDRLRQRDATFVAAAPLAAGLGLSALALVFHFFVYPGYAPPLAIDGASIHFQSELRYWDMHRAPFELWGEGIRMALAAAAVCLYASLSGRSSGAGRFYARSLLAAGLLAAVFSLGNWQPELFPGWLMAMMPSRTFNVLILGSLGLWIGLLAGHPDRVAFEVVLVAVAVLLGLARFTPMLLPLSLGAALWLDGSLRGRGLGSMPTARGVLQRSLQAAPAIVAAGALALVCLPRMSEVAAPSAAAVREDPVVRALRAGSGMVLVGSDINFIQAWTRRPVLLRGESIDVFAYAPEAAPAVATILARVYGIDFHSPPAEARRRGGLGRDSGRELWESRTLDDWIAVTREFGVTEIVTWNDWRLRLPLAARGQELNLYRVPRTPAP